VKNVQNTFCTLVFTSFCTLARLHPVGNREHRRKPQEKPAAEKSPNRAGATPLFGHSAAQKVSWGRSRPCAFFDRAGDFPRLGTDFGI